MNFGAKLCFTFMLSIGVLDFFTCRFYGPSVVVLLPLFSFGYIIRYLIYKEYLKDLLPNIMLSLLIMVLGLIPFLGIIIVVSWIWYNIKNSIETVKSLLPELGFSLILYSLLIFMFNPELSVILFLMYAIISYSYCLRISKMTDNVSDAIFRMSIMWLSPPIIGLLLLSILASIASIFKVNFLSFKSTVQTPQQVSGYMRGDTFVEGYTRNISQTVTTTSTQILPGTGSITASVSGSMNENLGVVEKQKRIEKKITSAATLVGIIRSIFRGAIILFACFILFGLMLRLFASIQ